MSEFGDIIKEALVGEESREPEPGRAPLKEAMEKFDRRLKTMRFMATFAILFMTVVATIGLIGLIRADHFTTDKALIGYAVAFLWAMTGIGWGKMWFAMMMNHTSIMKELKRVQITVLEAAEDPKGL